MAPSSPGPVIAALLACLLTGCAGNDSPAAVSPSITVSSPSPSNSNYTQARILANMAADALPCTDLKDIPNPEDAASEVECAGTFWIRTFHDKAQLDEDLAAPRPVGDDLLIGNYWTITTADPSTLTHVQAILGGKIRHFPCQEGLCKP